MNGPTPFQLAILLALQSKRSGEIYAGTAKGRHRTKEDPAAKRRKMQRERVARRSQTVSRRASS